MADQTYHNVTVRVNDYTYRLLSLLDELSPSDDETSFEFAVRCGLHAVTEDCRYQLKENNCTQELAKLDEFISLEYEQNLEEMERERLQQQ